MRSQGSTFFYLHGSKPEWRTASVDDMAVGDFTGLVLAGREGGPDVLTSEDGSLGRVVLPLGMAADEAGTIYLLGQRQPGVKRFVVASCSFEPLRVGGEFGQEVGQFYEQFGDPSNPLRSNIAVAAENLYVADRGNRRVQVFALGTMSVRHVWAARGDEGGSFESQVENAWEPVDVATNRRRAYILDRRYSRVYVHVPGTDRLRLFIQGPVAGNRWTRIAIDKEGRIYLLNAADSPARVEIYDPRGRYLETKTEAGEIRDRFETPAVILRRVPQRDRWAFSLPERLGLWCEACASERKRLAFKQACDDRVGAAAKKDSHPIAAINSEFDREGDRWLAVPSKDIGPKVFADRGEWRSEALDSAIYRCQWHRIEVDLQKLPAGTRVEVYTYADADKLSDSEAKQRIDNFGKIAYSVAGQLDPPRKWCGPLLTRANDACSCHQKSGSNDERAKQEACENDAVGRHEFLIQSREGQYLWLKLVFIGDGYDTPIVRALRVHYPRPSYLQYLPAVFSADDESSWFLERFLSIFQTEWDRLEQNIADVAALFDPQAVPAGKALDYLASWFALPLEGVWTTQQKRRLLEAISRIYFGNWKATNDKNVCLAETEPGKAARRGTPEGLRNYLQVYLQNITGLSTEAQGAFPKIDEGFRERQRLMVSLGDTSSLSHCPPLWGPGAVGRFHFGSFAREGEARLVSTGDPQHEIFQEFAHRFRVFVPSSWINTADEEEMVHRAVRAEKPAHTSYELCLVEPRFRVGLQSTVGVDTIVGAWPKARLACTHDANIPPSRLPRHCLGLDTVLGSYPGDTPTMHIGPKTRAGIDTVLN